MDLDTLQKQSQRSSQSCVLSPQQFTLITINCSVKDWIADKTTVVGPLFGVKEPAYREEVKQLVSRRKTSNLSLNDNKMKEITANFGTILESLGCTSQTNWSKKHVIPNYNSLTPSGLLATDKDSKPPPSTFAAYYRYVWLAASLQLCLHIL